MKLKTSPYISVVVPLLNEEKNIEVLYNALIITLKDVSENYEIIFVDDGSSDKSFEVIQRLNSQNERIVGISFSRNFGHQIGLAAGLHHAKGEIVISMDADMQHPPEIIPQLVEKYREGFDIVNTRRIDPKSIGFFKKTSSKMFYKFFNSFSDIKIESASSDFRLMSRKAVEAYNQIDERDRFTRGLVKWIGFKQSIVAYNAAERFAGKSKYTLKKMIKFALTGITSFSSKPLRLSFYLGLFVFVFGIFYSIFAIVMHFLGFTVQGWTSMFVTIMILGGIQLLSIGIIGEYIGKIFIESKHRPLYFIKNQTSNLYES